MCSYAWRRDSVTARTRVSSWWVPPRRPPVRTGWQASLMRSIEATPNLEYLGQRTHAEVNELLARAHIFVNTSTHEGFPNTFIQAWLREVAVVSLSVRSRSGSGAPAGRHRRRQRIRVGRGLRALIDHPEVAPVSCGAAVIMPPHSIRYPTCRSW